MDETGATSVRLARKSPPARFATKMLQEMMAMDDTTGKRDQPDEEALTCELSDDALEVASGVSRLHCMVSYSTCRYSNPGCC